MPTFGDRLRTARIIKGFTQEEVAAKVGHGKGWYQKLENNKGNPTWADMVDVGRDLDVSLDHLAYGAPLDPGTWTRFQHLPAEYKTQIKQFINALYDRETLLRVAGKDDGKEKEAAPNESD